MADEIPTQPGITVLILVPNAGDRLARCLHSVAWAERVFCVVDPRCNDGSDEVARRFTDWVVAHEYKNAADQRNWALPQIQTEWTLVLDADEWVSTELRSRIGREMADPNSADGFRVKRDSWFMGRLMRHCGWERDYNIRLFRTRKGRYLEKRVHSKVVVEGRMGQIDEPMYHDTYRSFEEYFNTFHRFTLWGAEDLFERGKRARYTDLTLRPFVKFLKMYVLRQGFRDGYHGAVLCMLGAFSVYMKYAHLWRLGRIADGHALTPPPGAESDAK
jgi:glycosyltransferase involved in cell wall biosynthesis